MINKIENISTEWSKDNFFWVEYMERVMSFFTYNIDSLLYFGIGNGRLLTIPFLFDTTEYFRAFFDYANDVCYFSGAWEYDYLTEDSKGFIEKLKEKWFEWADMQQEMPIIVGLKKQEISSFYIMVGFDKFTDTVKFIDKSGKYVHYNVNDIEKENEFWGFMTIDVPFNFMVKSDYYRDVGRGNLFNSVKTGVRLLNCKEMMGFLSEILDCIHNDDTHRLNILLKMFVENVTRNGLPVRLFRDEFGDYLKKYGYLEIGEEYKDVALMWEEIILSIIGINETDVNKISKVAEKEIKLATRLKG